MLLFTGPSAEVSSSEKEAPFSVRAKSISHYSVPEGNGLEEGKRNNLIYYGNTNPLMCFSASLFQGEVRVKLLEMRTVEFREYGRPKQQRENKLLMTERNSLE